MHGISFFKANTNLDSKFSYLVLLVPDFILKLKSYELFNRNLLPLVTRLIAQRVPHELLSMGFL